MRREGAGRGASSAPARSRTRRTWPDCRRPRRGGTRARRVCRGEPGGDGVGRLARGLEDRLHDAVEHDVEVVVRSAEPHGDLRPREARFHRAGRPLGGRCVRLTHVEPPDVPDRGRTDRHRVLGLRASRRPASCGVRRAAAARWRRRPTFARVGAGELRPRRREDARGGGPAIRGPLTARVREERETAELALLDTRRRLPRRILGLVSLHSPRFAFALYA